MVSLVVSRSLVPCPHSSFPSGIPSVSRTTWALCRSSWLTVHGTTNQGVGKHQGGQATTRGAVRQSQNCCSASEEPSRSLLEGRREHAATSRGHPWDMIHRPSLNEHTPPWQYTLLRILFLLAILGNLLDGGTRLLCTGRFLFATVTSNCDIYCLAYEWMSG